MSAHLSVFYKFARACSVHMNLMASKESENIKILVLESRKPKADYDVNSKVMSIWVLFSWKTQTFLFHLSLKHKTRNLYLKIKESEFKCFLFPLKKLKKPI